MSDTKPAQSMFVIDLQFLVSPDEVEPLIADHVKFLEKKHDTVRIIASGAKVPKTGAVMIAVSDSKATLEAYLSDDPFCSQNVAKYTITECNPSEQGDE